MGVHSLRLRLSLRLMVIHLHFGHLLALVLLVLVHVGLRDWHCDSGIPLVVNIGAVVYFVAALGTKLVMVYPW